MTELERAAAAAAPIMLADPLAEFLGFKDGGVITYTLEDAGRYAGHLCPTVATAFEMARAGLKALWPAGTPVRGGVRVTVHSAPDAFANGPLGRVIGYVTGASGIEGFRGLAGHWSRQNLLKFDASRAPFGAVTFERADTGAGVTVEALPDALPHEPDISANLKPALAGDAAAGSRFRAAWARRVKAVVEHADKVVRVVRAQ